MLTYNGYRYTRQRKCEREYRANRFGWRCVFRQNGRYACKSYATTYCDDNQQKAQFRGQHYHPPS